MNFQIKRYFPLLGTLVPCFLLNCQAPNPGEMPSSQELVVGEQATGPAIPADSAPNPTEEPTDPNAPPFKLPTDWSGTGVLASKGTSTPNAPNWGKKSQVEIIQSEGTYYLRATSKAEKINNPSLLEQTAANRARALLQKTLKNHLLT